MNSIHSKLEVAVIPMAGYGTRMMPITTFLSKSSLPVGLYPAYYYLLKELKEAGIKEVHIICNENVGEIFRFLKPTSSYIDSIDKDSETLSFLMEITSIKNSLRIYFHYQDDAKGLGGAILSVSDVICAPFLLVLGDDIHDSSSSTRAMIKFYGMFKKPIFMFSVENVKAKEARLYGSISYTRLPVSRLFKVNKLYEKKDRKEEKIFAINGRYILDESIFGRLMKIESLKKNLGEELELADALNDAIGDNFPVYAYRSSSTRYDIGMRKGYYKAFIKRSIEEYPELIEWVNC